MKEILYNKKVHIQLRFVKYLPRIILGMPPYYLKSIDKLINSKSHLKILIDFFSCITKVFVV